MTSPAKKESAILRYFKGLLMKNKAFLLGQVLAVQGLMQLLMKNRNTGEKWSREEIKEIKKHLRQISKMVPVIIVFLLPGGSLLLPFLAEVLDRRKTIRRPPSFPPKDD
jgi:cob(I)alamin adenosyltransferase